MHRRAAMAALFLVAGTCAAQVCRLSVAGLNRDRRVLGPVAAECPGPVHTTPFGNWGVTSNFGVKGNSHQFQGWCHDSYICDNNGNCRDECPERWYQWNSCTINAAYSPPNCSLYNAADCTIQSTTTGINVHGTHTVEAPVRCPIDNNGDGIADAGGCADLTEYTHGVNFMSLYELDPLSPDQLVQSLYFPPTPVKTPCGVYGCGPAQSEWVAPSFYDSPAEPALVYAEMSMFLNGGEFSDPGRRCAALIPLCYNVAAASYTPTAAASSIVSSFGPNLSTVTAVSTSAPPLVLGGTRVQITDSRGQVAGARLLYTSPGQVNWLVPGDVATGLAHVMILDEKGAVRAAGELILDTVAPALFSASSTGEGVAAAVAVRVLPGGTQRVEEVVRCAPEPGGCVAVPVEAPRRGEQLVLLLFGTGIRGRASLADVSATIGGVPADVQYAGVQFQYPGLDQVNVGVPAAVSGAGLVEIQLTVGGIRANAVTVLFE